MLRSSTTIVARWMGLGCIGLSPLVASAGAPPIYPGTPLDGTNPGGALVIITLITQVGTAQAPEVSDFLGITHTAPGDIVVLTDPAHGMGRDNWAGIARFFNPADPTGASGLAATEMEGYLSSSTDFTAFELLPNVLYEPLGTSEGGPIPVIDSIYTQFGPAGAVLNAQTAIYHLTISGAVPEPGTGVSLGLGAACLALGRRRRWRAVIAQVGSFTNVHE